MKKYPGLTSTESRGAKYVFQRPEDTSPRLGIIVTESYQPTNGGTFYTLKDAHTGEIVANVFQGFIKPNNRVQQRTV